MMFWFLILLIGAMALAASVVFACVAAVNFKGDVHPLPGIIAAKSDRESALGDTERAA